MLFKDGWVASDFALTPNMASLLYNLRVEVDGLHLVEGWKEFTTRTASASATPPFNVAVVTSPNGRRYSLLFHGNAAVWAIRSPMPDERVVANVTLVSVQGMYSDAPVPPVAVMGPYVYYISSSISSSSPTYPSPLFRWQFPDESDYVGTFQRVVPNQGDPNIPCAKAIGALGFRLVLGNIKTYKWDEENGEWILDAEYPNRIMWSGLDNPAFWDTTAYFDLFDQDTIVALYPLGDTLAIYTLSDVYIMQQTGDVVAPFSITKVLDNPELLHPNAILDISAHEFRGHILLTWTGVWVFTGGETQLLSTNIRNIWKDFVKAGRYIRAYYDPVNEEIIIADHYNAQALVYQLRWRTWYKRDFDLHAFGSTGYPRGWETAEQDYSLVLKCIGVKQEIKPNEIILHFYEYGGVKRDTQPATAELITPIQEVVPPSQQAILHAGTAYWTTEAAAPGQMEYKVIVGNHWNDIAANLPNVDTHTYYAMVGKPMPLVTMYLRGRAFRWHLKFTGLEKPLKVHGHIAYFRPPVGR